MNILALDLGSTSFKAAVYTAGLRSLTAGSHRLRYRYVAGGGVELDAAQVQTAVRGALAAAGVVTHDIGIVALTSQAQTGTITDVSGRALIPFVSWQDARAAAASSVLARQLPAFGVHSSFAEPLSGLQVAQLRRLRPGAKTLPLQLPTYLVRLWSGECVIDTNLAAMSGLYSLVLRDWWPEALRACGLRARQMPRLIQVGQIGAYTGPGARRFGLPVGVPIVLAGNDQTAGAYAERLETQSSLLITLGTAQVAYVCRPKLPSPRAGAIRGPYPGGRYYRMAADGCGGNIVNWAQTVIAGCGDDRRFFRAAADAPAGCRGLTFAAGLDAGEGAWQGLGLVHTPGDLARAVLEGLSQRTAALVKRLGVRVADHPVLAAGGGSEQPLWRQLVAEALGVPLRATAARPLLGAARMAARHVSHKTITQGD